MDSEVRLFLQRSEDEFLLCENDMRISTEERLKGVLGIPNDKTFFSSVINHAYYAIFNCAKAYLLAKGIRTKTPKVHRKTYDEFAKFVDSGELDVELLRIYEDVMGKSEVLLDIFFREKRKRGIFTYNVKSEANLPYARDSVNNARKFVSTITAVLERS